MWDRVVMMMVVVIRRPQVKITTLEKKKSQKIFGCSAENEIKKMRETINPDSEEPHQELAIQGLHTLPTVKLRAV